MFFGSKTPIKKDKYFINLGDSHAASYNLPIESSYPYLIAKKLDLGYVDFAYSRTSIEYSDYALNTVDFTKAEFVLWQLAYPWRKHNWNTQDIQKAREDNIKSLTLKESFKIFAKVISKYKDSNVFFIFINQEYTTRYLKQLVKLNDKVFSENIEFIDFGFDEKHGGVNSQKLIANKMCEFLIKYDKKN